LPTTTTPYTCSQLSGNQLLASLDGDISAHFGFSGVNGKAAVIDLANPTRPKLVRGTRKLGWKGFRHAFDETGRLFRLQRCRFFVARPPIAPSLLISSSGGTLTDSLSRVTAMAAMLSAVDHTAVCAFREVSTGRTDEDAGENREPPTCKR